MTVQHQLAKVEELVSAFVERQLQTADQHGQTKSGGPVAAVKAPPATKAPSVAPQKAPQDQRAAGRPKRAQNKDEIWARRNLRWQDGLPIADIANVLRILERHEDFRGRFKYNEMIHRVVDSGVIMLDWRLSELCAALQERFIPGVEDSVASKALVVVAYRTGVSS